MLLRRVRTLAGAMSEPMMLAVVQYGLTAGEVELRELPQPQPGEGEAVLAVGAVGVCGSDVHQFHATQSWPVATPVVLGHEFTGTVAALGPGVQSWQEGDRVVSETAAFICGVCPLCRSGNYNVCPHRKGFGYGIDGAMAGYVRVPARCLHRIPDHLPFETTALTEPACVAYNAVVERSALRPGDSVLVLGPGPIGLLCLLMARLRGAGTTIVAGLSRDASRLALARTLGASHTVEIDTMDTLETVRGTDDGLGIDLVIDAAGAASAFELALAAVRPMGQITKVGWGPGPLGFSLDPLVQKAVNLNGAFSHNHSTWERVLGLLASGQLNVAPLVGVRAPLAEWRQAFDGMHTGDVVKAVLTP